MPYGLELHTPGENAKNITKRSAPTTTVNPTLERFVAHLEDLPGEKLRLLAEIPVGRSAEERRYYLAAWQRAINLYGSYRLNPAEAACMARVEAAQEILGNLSVDDPTDPRAGLLALGVARALLLRPGLGEKDFIILTGEWRRIFGNNSLR
jgi:hypothetical protein